MKLHRYHLLALLISFLLILLQGQLFSQNGSDCFPFLDISNDTLDFGDYNSSSTITSNAVVAPNGNVNFAAGDGITLTEGFKVSTDSEFTASIEDCIVNTFGCIPNVEVTTTPIHIDLCNGNSATINYSLCNLTSNTLTVPYNIVPTSGITCISATCNGSIILNANECTTVVHAIESSLLVGDQGEVLFDITSPIICPSVGSSILTTIDTPKEISVIASHTDISICPGYTDQISYQICNSNPANCSFDYNIYALGPLINMNITPQSGNLTVDAFSCITLEVDVTNFLQAFGFANIRFVPDACMTNNSVINTNLTVPVCSYLDPMVFIEGVDKQFDPVTCEFEMRRNHIIPDASPYPSLGYVEVGGQTNSVCSWAPNDLSIIDWVFVELREMGNPATVVHTKNALLYEDGRVIDLNTMQGQNLPLAFHDVNPGDYFVTVRHRNHLDVMSDNALPIIASATTPCHFTDGTHASNFQKVAVFNDLICGQIVFHQLYAADVNNDGVINATDRSIISNNQGQIGYTLADCELSDLVDGVDQDKAWENRNKVSNVPQ